MAVKCKDLIYTHVNALTFRITGCTETLTPVTKNGEIVKLKSSDTGPTFTKGLTVEIKKRKYKVEIIKRVRIRSKVYYDISMAKRTKSSTFIFPMLTGNRRLFLWDSLFVNSFLHTEEDPNCISLLYRFSADLLFLKFEKALSKFKNFKRRYDPSPNYVMFVFNVPENYEDEYILFINGKYSGFSQDYKLQILNFHNLEMDSEVAQILFRHSRRRRALEEKLNCELPEGSELLSIVEKEDETYDPEVYKFKKLI